MQRPRLKHHASEGITESLRTGKKLVAEEEVESGKLTSNEERRRDDEAVCTMGTMTWVTEGHGKEFQKVERCLLHNLNMTWEP